MRLVFMGTPDFSVPCLEMLLHSEHQLLAVVTQPDRPRGRGLMRQPSPVKVTALQHGVPVLQPEAMNNPEFLARLREAAPELAVVIAFGHILKPAVLELPAEGCINVHASLLPKYRGAAPIAWAIIAGETETGITTIRMDPGMDTGPILLQRSLAIAAEDTGGSLHDQLAQLGAEVLRETLTALAGGKLEPKAQDNRQAGLAPLLKKEDGRMDWSRSAPELERRVRALNPWPGSFFILRGNAVKVWKARVVSGRGRPGQVLAADQEGITVACGEAALRITELQPPGKRRMSAPEFIRGHDLPANAILERD